MESPSRCPGLPSTRRPLDGGLWFASPETQELLEYNGLDTLAAALDFGEPLAGHLLRRSVRHEYKSVRRATLHWDGRPRETVYVKRQWKWARWLPRPRDVRRQAVFQPSPVLEWRGLTALRAAGVDAASPLALFMPRGFASRSAVVVSAVPPAMPLNDFIAAGGLSELDDLGRTALTEAIVATIHKIHAAGLCWGSMKARHFYPEALPQGAWRIWLIDAESVFVNRWFGGVARDRATFLKSLRQAEPDAGFLRSVEAGLNR